MTTNTDGSGLRLFTGEPQYENYAILRKYGYPPDKQEKATRTVLEQAELIAAEWAT